MKFVFIAPRFHTNFYYLVKVLLEHNHQVDFLALYQGQSEAHNLVTPIILGLAGKRRPPLVSFLKQFWRSRPDVVIIKDIVTPYSLLAFVTAFILRKKIIFLTQIPKFRAQAVSGSVQWLWRLGRAYALTPVLGDKKFPNYNHNLIYIPFVIAVDESNITRNKDKAISILSVGKWQDRKRQLLLIKAIKKIKTDWPVKLTLIGEEDEIEYLKLVKDYIKDNKLESVVKIIPHRSWDKMVDLYRQADLFVLPSVNESAAYSLLEAMSYGLAVISSNDNGTQWYIEAGQNGFVFEKDNLTDLALKIKQTISDREYLFQMRQKSLELAKINYQPEMFYQRLMELIDK